MASFKIQVEDLIGSVGDDQLITDSLIACGTEIIKLTKDDQLKDNADESTISTSGLDISNRRVLGVHKDSYPAKKVNYTEIAQMKDSDSIYYANATNPVFYYNLEKVYVVADGSVTAGKLIYVPTQPTADGTNLITHASTATMYFPLEAEKLMVLGAATRCLKQRISTQIVTDEDTELAQATMAQLQVLEASYDKELQKYLT